MLTCYQQQPRPVMRKSLLLLVFCASTLLVGCNDLCDNEAPAEHASPDGRWKYVSFDRNCVATTGSNLQISVLPSSQSLSNEAANAFAADGSHGATSFVAQPEWLDSHPQWSPQNRPFVVTSKPAILRLLLDISLGTASDRAANWVAVRSSLSSRLSQLFAVATFFGEKYCTRMA